MIRPPPVFWLLLPAVGVIFIFGAIPLLISLVYSFLTANPYGGVAMPPTISTAA
jgi:spermidine/putrescine transport system permease protein